MEETAQPLKERRGFGRMTPERRREIASRGAKTLHERGKAYRWTPEAAREAGRKGGRVSPKPRA